MRGSPYLVQDTDFSVTPLERLTIVAMALTLLGAGIWGIVVEPFSKGSILMAITRDHGIDTGDLPFIVLLAVAAWLLWRSLS